MVLTAITVLQYAKNRSSDHVQNGQNFILALNIGQAFSYCFHTLEILCLLTCLEFMLWPGMSQNNLFDF